MHPNLSFLSVRIPADESNEDSESGVLTPETVHEMLRMKRIQNVSSVDSKYNGYMAENAQFFRRYELPSVSLARPPVGWHSTLEHEPQITTVCA